jgi:hypothetical protein
MISGVSLDRDLAGMLMVGKYPQRLLPTFLHEMVHHWCFHSPVGSVLSYLQLRARRNSLLLLLESHHDPGDVDRSFDILLDLLRYEAAINLMRPLAEGMALFAEFDVTPGESTAISTPLNFTYLSFHEIESGKAPYEGLAELLAQHRLGDDLMERKANLLVQPFTCVGGGYLPGYMLVKNLWLHMLRERHCHRFWDRDLFLSYLQSFFYNDYEFIATLLSPETSEYGVTNSVSLYCQKRLKDFMDNTTDDLVGEFETEVVARAANRRDETIRDLPEPWPGSDPQTARLGRQRLKDLLDELHGEADNELERSVRRMESWVIAQRELMCIGSFKERVRVNEHGMVHVGRLPGQEKWNLDFIMPLIAVGADSGVPAQDGEGLIEFFLAPTSLYRAMAITIGGKRVATSFLGVDVKPEVEEQFRSNMLGYTADPKVRETWKSVVSEVLSKHGLDSILEHYQQQISLIANEHYTAKALLFTSDEDLGECLDVLRENGVFEVLGRDAALVRALASLSMAASVHPVYDFVKEILANSSIDISQLLEKLKGASSRFHLPFVRQIEKVLISYL